jgi:hypothetical protein
MWLLQKFHCVAPPYLAGTTQCFGLLSLEHSSQCIKASREAKVEAKIRNNKNKSTVINLVESGAVRDMAWDEKEV